MAVNVVQVPTLQEQAKCKISFFNELKKAAFPVQSCECLQRSDSGWKHHKLAKDVHASPWQDLWQVI